MAKFLYNSIHSFRQTFLGCHLVGDEDWSSFTFDHFSLQVAYYKELNFSVHTLKSNLASHIFRWSFMVPSKRVQVQFLTIKKYNRIAKTTAMSPIVLEFSKVEINFKLHKGKQWWSFARLWDYIYISISWKCLLNSWVMEQKMT